MSTPWMIAIVGVLLSSLIIGLQTDQLLGMEERAIERTLPLVADRLEAVMISVHDMDQVEVEMQLQREMNLSIEEGEPSIVLNDARQPIQPGMEYSLEEGRSDKICASKKPGEPVKISSGGC